MKQPRQPSASRWCATSCSSSSSARRWPASLVGSFVVGLAFAFGWTPCIGPILGAILLSTLPETLRFLRAQREVINGLVIMLAIIYLPRGLADPHFWRRLRFWSRVPAAAQE